MRRGLTLLVTLAIAGGAVSVALAQGAKAAKAQGPVATGPAAKQESRAAAPEVMRLRAEIHRTLAALMEARSARQPDQARIARLTGELQGLRAKLRAAGGAGPAWAAGSGGAAGAWECPWGGPGLRRGSAWGGGRGRGRGYGRGQGWGGGRRYGPGWSRGQGGGRGPAFVDENNNGICDHREAFRAAQK